MSTTLSMDSIGKKKHLQCLQCVPTISRLILGMHSRHFVSITSMGPPPFTPQKIKNLYLSSTHPPQIHHFHLYKPLWQYSSCNDFSTKYIKKRLSNLILATTKAFQTQKKEKLADGIINCVLFFDLRRKEKPINA